ncbi:MAG: peptidylprolyl isomerase, partial [Planctomycetaceae bacterium]
MHGDPMVNMEWESKTIPDDPVVESNQRGYVTFAKTGRPNSRSTQFFINFTDNSRLDTQGFSPFAKVVNGLDVVDKINTEYDERPLQHRIAKFGNRYLDDEFPNLDFITTARIIDEPAVKHPIENSADADSKTGDTKPGGDAAPGSEKNESDLESPADSDGSPAPAQPK